MKLAIRRARTLVVSTAFAVLLAACGGGDPTPETENLAESSGMKQATSVGASASTAQVLSRDTKTIGDHPHSQ